MSTWRKKAIEIISPSPQMANDLQKAKTRFQFWSELWLDFEKLHATPEKNVIGRIYDYAFWCLTDSVDLPLQGQALDDFFKRLPNLAITRQKMARYISFDDFAVLRDIFTASQLSQEEFKNFEMDFIKKAQSHDASGLPKLPNRISLDMIKTIEAKLAELAKPWILDCPVCKNLARSLNADVGMLPEAAYQLKLAETGQGWDRKTFLHSTSLTLRCTQCGRFYFYEYDYESSPCPPGGQEFESIRPVTSEETDFWVRHSPVNSLQQKNY